VARYHTPSGRVIQRPYEKGHREEYYAAHRERLVHWGPRTLDLDILYYDDEVIDTPELTIPHPGIPERDFVLRPLNQIAPNLRHPLLHRTTSDMLSALNE